MYRVRLIVLGLLACASLVAAQQPQTGIQMKKFDFRNVLDNSIVDRLVKEGFFEKLFGPGIKAEQERKAKIAFR